MATSSRSLLYERWLNSSTGRNSAIDFRQPADNLGEEHRTFAWERASSFLEPYEQETVFLLLSRKAHEKGTIHRDVKPENMFLRHGHTVILGDFGIAAIVQTTLSMKTKDIRGTASYMAPEQFGGHPFPASDQYAFRHSCLRVVEWISTFSRHFC